MTTTLLTPGAKEALRKSIRALRERLVADVAEAARGEYQLDVAAEKARLSEARRRRRERLDEWLDEQVRAAAGERSKGKSANGKEAEVRSRALRRAVQEAAYTLLNRLVLLRILEHHGFSSPHVVTGGLRSTGYASEFLPVAGPLGGDDSKGYAALLGAVFDELALELPGLYGHVGLTALFPIPAATLRGVVEALNDPALESAWGDDTTLGWVYQYWNDPEREALDAKIAGGGKIEPDEIAPKTQMFTERYMVEWLLQNSLGFTWLAICRKNGWTPDADTVLPVLEARRAEWRAKREAGEVALDALMPIEAGLESDWKYYVPQPIPDDAVGKAPSSIAEVKLLDPACGSGHFLVIAFGLLAAMYREESRHRNRAISDEEIAESILANNLHGVDIDPRATQIAAAALYVKAKTLSPTVRPRRVNLVAPTLKLGSLPDDDPSLVQLRAELKRDAGISEDLTRRLVGALAGVDHLGTLLKVDAAVAVALESATREIERGLPGQGDLFMGFAMQQVKLSMGEAKATVLDKLEQFLARHTDSGDLGLRLGGEQLASGVRFVRLVKEGSYDVVVGNPPYQGISKTAGFEYVVKNYPRGKADLYAAFLERGLELAREGGISALLTMRGWMFLGQFEKLRKAIVHENDLRLLGDVDRGAFESVPDEVLATTMSIVHRAPPGSIASLAVQPTPLDDRSRDSGRTDRKRAALLAQVGRYEFDPKGFEVIEGEPIVYWWSDGIRQRYSQATKLLKLADIRKGLITSDDVRFVRRPWECELSTLVALRREDAIPQWSASNSTWAPLVKGAAGRAWCEGFEEAIIWRFRGLAVKVLNQHLYGSYTRQIMNENYYFRVAVAFTTIGNRFRSRVHRYRSVIGSKGSSAYPAQSAPLATVLLAMNTSFARFVLESLNPGIDFQVGDVNRLPVSPVDEGETVFKRIEQSFGICESHREPSVEFRFPGPSPWRSAQAWAQLAVDRPDGAPLPPYTAELDPPEPEAFVSFALGVALGRFGAAGEGILDVAPKTALPGGILFVGPDEAYPDSLTYPAVVPLLAAWDAYVPAKGKKPSLRDGLRKDFFAYHKALYETRPIYFPLSSEKKTFVAWVSIHRWRASTLTTLLADHLHPVLRQLDAEIVDANVARTSSEKRTAIAGDRRYETAKRLRDELADFIVSVTQIAERGAPPADASCPARETDAPFAMDLDDGVMINSAALWPLLAPQWADPKKWWKQLCLAEGRKDYDWAHLAKRYFPSRVEAKCADDPSLAVAHGCFWKYHPAKAFAWELRLQDEIREGFTIDEAGSDAARTAWIAAHPAEAQAAREKERVRRERKAAREEENDETADDEEAGDSGDE